MNGPNGAAVTVLISSAGRRVELIRCFREDAARLGMSVRVIATDVDPTWSSACGAADAWFEVPRSTDRGFVDRMVELCEQNAVSIIVPTIDTELAVLSESVDRFGGVPTVVAVSTPAVVALARDKAATAAFLSSIGVPTPRTALASEAAGQSWAGPVIVKPRGGSSSIGIKRLRSIGELTEEDATSANVIQELLAGEEYTVNVYFGPDGALRAAVPHWRRETRAGEVSKGQTRRHPALEQVARRLGDGLSGARGALCFQAIVDAEERVSVFEINARFGGGYPLAHRAGARFSQWMLEERTGRTPSYDNDWTDGTVMLRYDAAMFRDGTSG